MDLSTEPFLSWKGLQNPTTTGYSTHRLGIAGVGPNSSDDAHSGDASGSRSPPTPPPVSVMGPQRAPPRGRGRPKQRLRRHPHFPLEGRLPCQSPPMWHYVVDDDDDDGGGGVEWPGEASETTPLLGAHYLPPAMESSKASQYMGAVAACISAMAVGTTMGWTSSAESLKDSTQSFHIDDDAFSWVGAFLSIGAIIGAIPLGILANVIGRKKIMVFLGPPMITGYLLLAWADNVWMLYIARMILGAATGAYCVVVPMYTGEIAESSIRGVLGSYFQLLITAGILFVYILNAVNLTLFWINIACAFIPAVMMVCVMFFPDTPRWYLSKGYISEAEDALRFYRKPNINVEKELEETQNSIEEERSQKLPCSKAFSTTAAKKGLFLALSVMLFQQFSGINAVVFFSKQIFNAAHSTLEPSLATVIVGVCQVAATYASTLLIDRLGRRILLIVSGASMAISGAILGVYFYLDYTKEAQKIDIGWLPILCMIVFIVMFSVGYGPIPWLYMGEVFSSQIKETAMSIATVVNWISVFIVTKFYAQLSEAIGNYWTFWIFSIISVAGCFFTFFFVVETKGKNFETIQQELGGLAEDQSSSSDIVNSHDQRRDVERH